MTTVEEIAEEIVKHDQALSNLLISCSAGEKDEVITDKFLDYLSENPYTPSEIDA